MSKETDQSDNKLIQDISDLKKEVKDIAFKIDIMLEILNSFTIMLAEDDEDLEEDDEDNESWVSPEQDEDWNSYDEDEDDEY